MLPLSRTCSWASNRHSVRSHASPGCRGVRSRAGGGFPASNSLAATSMRGPRGLHTHDSLPRSRMLRCAATETSRSSVSTAMMLFAARRAARVRGRLAACSRRRLSIAVLRENSGGGGTLCCRQHFHENCTALFSVLCTVFVRFVFSGMLFSMQCWFVPMTWLPAEIGCLRTGAVGSVRVPTDPSELLAAPY